MASSRKRPSGELVAEAGRFLGSIDLRGKRLAVGLSGGVDSVTLLHILKNCAAGSGFSLNAIHVHHGLSRNAGAWARFCRALCTRWEVPLAVRRVKVAKGGKGLEAAAREARYRAFRNRDRKSTRLNSSHLVISYAVFCLKKKKKTKKESI